jgi:hypothetical protein
VQALAIVEIGQHEEFAPAMVLAGNLDDRAAELLLTQSAVFYI